MGRSEADVCVKLLGSSESEGICDLCPHRGAGGDGQKTTQIFAGRFCVMPRHRLFFHLDMVEAEARYRHTCTKIYHDLNL